MSWDELLAAAERIRAQVAADPDPDAHPEVARLSIAGIGWATVEAERAIHELDAALAGDAVEGQPAPWTELDRDPALGARVWQRPAVPRAAGEQPRPAILALEPDTEGKLAASLVRFGEGVAVVYLGDGPIRPGRLLVSARPWGPHVVLV